MTSSGLGLQKVMNLFSDNKKVSNDKTVSNDNVKLGASACKDKCNSDCIFTGGTERNASCFKACVDKC